MAERVLIVDDDESLLDICEVGLRLAGYETATAANGEAALQRIEAQAFDLVITDVKMPGSVDGHELVRRVKAMRPGTEVIVVAGTPTIKSAIATLKDGASDYIIKPFVIDHLKTVVRRCLDHRRLREELSSERAMRQELKAAYEELQKVEQLKEAILARVSHEIKTPLSEIIMAIHLLGDSNDRLEQDNSEKGKKYVAIARTACQRLERTLSNLLTFSEISKPLTTQEAASVNMEALCRGVVEGLRSLWGSRGLKVSLTFDPGLRSVRATPELLKKAFEHLVHNAILFNRPDGSIRILGRMSGACVEVAISDTGEGIPDSEFNQIFDSFYQVANYLTRKVDGMGMGLAITRRIVEEHRGTISVSSRLGEGSTFTVSLPAEVAVTQPAK